jgi:hypothetical protein
MLEKFQKIKPQIWCTEDFWLLVFRTHFTRLDENRGRGKEKHQGITPQHPNPDPYTDHGSTKNQIAPTTGDDQDGI